MKTVSVDIKIPDGHEVEEISIVWPGYESSLNSAVGKMVVKTKAAKPFLINGVPSDWPEWLDCDWIVKNKFGKLHCYNVEPPELHLGHWTQSENGRVGELYGTTLGIPGPWEQSKRENPRRKK